MEEILITNEFHKKNRYPHILKLWIPMSDRQMSK